MLVFWNGALYDDADAPISPTDRGLLLGEGVFETMRVYDKTPFAISRHLIRLRKGSSRLGFSSLPPDDFFLDAIEQLLDSNKINNGRLRITVTGGSGPLGPQRANEDVNILITTGKLGVIAASAHVGVSPWRISSRAALAGIKSTSYGENVMTLNWANEKHYQEALLLNEFENVVEATASNVFLVFDGQLFTPPLTAGCLPGITRELVIESLDVLQHDLTIGQLRYVEEAFLTSSLREVQPVASINGRLLNMNGPHTDKARSTILSHLISNTDP